mmetsp:Transcript_11581/g.32890  ORF Transcript_11581/g.32890 Transcript_11581/m.32890 type:complete len:236 (-) Transcript_11581:72-779(-)
MPRSWRRVPPMRLGYLATLTLGTMWKMSWRRRVRRRRRKKKQRRPARAPGASSTTSSPAPSGWPGPRRRRTTSPSCCAASTPSANNTHTHNNTHTNNPNLPIPTSWPPGPSSSALPPASWRWRRDGGTRPTSGGFGIGNSSPAVSHLPPAPLGRSSTNGPPSTVRRPAVGRRRRRCWRRRRLLPIATRVRLLFPPPRPRHRRWRRVRCRRWWKTTATRSGRDARKMLYFLMHGTF